MAVSLGDVLTTLQNAVRSVNRLTRQVSATFPHISEFSTAARGSLGTVSFNSSAPIGFMAVTTSSGFTRYAAIYPSS